MSAKDAQQIIREMRAQAGYTSDDDQHDEDIEAVAEAAYQEGMAAAAAELAAEANRKAAAAATAPSVGFTTRRSSGRTRRKGTSAASAAATTATAAVAAAAAAPAYVRGLLLILFRFILCICAKIVGGGCCHPFTLQVLQGGAAIFSHPPPLLRCLPSGINAALGSRGRPLPVAQVRPENNQGSAKLPFGVGVLIVIGAAYASWCFRMRPIRDPTTSALRKDARRRNKSRDRRMGRRRSRR